MAMISVDRNTLVEIADDKPDLLSAAFVYDIIDQQCAAKALRMFSLEVETYLRERGHDESAEFVHVLCGSGMLHVTSMEHVLITE